MKRIALLAAAAALALSACGPQVFTMNMEMRHPSPSGVDLSGKRLAVVYLEDDPARDSVFCPALSNSFAEKLEEDYFGGNEAINVFRMDKGEGDYASRDTLINLVMDTGADVVFLFDAPIFGQVSLGEPVRSAYAATDSASIVRASVPYTVNLYVYDAMNQADTVKTLFGASTAHHNLYSPLGEDSDVTVSRLWEQLTAHGEATGRKSAEKFSPTWAPESFNVYYFDQDKWLKATQDAYDFKWHDAMERWLSLASSRDPEVRSCAEYDLALACFMLGDLDLATEWLDRSDADVKLPSSDSLRGKIRQRRSPAVS